MNHIIRETRIYLAEIHDEIRKSGGWSRRCKYDRSYGRGLNLHKRNCGQKSRKHRRKK